MSGTTFYGQATAVLDAKNRVTIPADFRRKLGRDEDKLAICYDESGAQKVGCLQCLSIDAWESYAALLESVPSYDEAVMGYTRLLLGNVHVPEIDKQNRILLPERMLEYAGITDSKVLFVGVGKRFEIWNPDRYASYIAGVQSSLDTRVEAVDAHVRNALLIQQASQQAAAAAAQQAAAAVAAGLSAGTVRSGGMF